MKAQFLNFGKCSSTLTLELMGIQNAIIMSYNFINKRIEIESDYKIAIEVLLWISPIPWKVCVVFSFFKIAYEVALDVRSLWCPKACNGVAH